MKIFKALASGISRTSAAWKGILIMWLASLLLVLLPVMPVMAILKSALDRSMITEKLSEGFNLDIVPDLGPVFFSFLSSLSSAIVTIVLAGFLLNVFLTSGMYGILRSDQVNRSASEFFRSALQNFRSFFVIMFIMSIIIILILIIIIFITAFIITSPDSLSTRTMYVILFLSLLTVSFIMLMLLVVSDYARTWKIIHPDGSGFRAIGFGFSQAFRTFISSFLFMLTIVSIQFLFLLVTFRIISEWRPVTGTGIFLLFLVSQLLFFIKIVLRTLRYAGIFSLMEMYNRYNDPGVMKSNPIVIADTGTGYTTIDTDYKLGINT